MHILTLLALLTLLSLGVQLFFITLFNVFN